MPRAVVLLSGGLDSAVVLGLARESGLECHCLTFEYGQRHRVEVERARSLAEQLGARSHHVVESGLGSFARSSLTGHGEVPQHALGAEAVPSTYVPARNTVFLAYGLALAEAVAAEEVHIGANVVDYSGYPDCRPEFLEAFEAMAALGTKAGLEGARLRIVAPLLAMDKRAIVAEALRLGIDPGMTHSCYDPGPGGTPCGGCDSCLIRSAAFRSLGVPDTALPPAPEGAQADAARR